jgi:hypothetical protein
VEVLPSGNGKMSILPFIPSCQQSLILHANILFFVLLFQLLYCSICCEPFHLFCLEEEDRPLESSKGDNWVCRRCQFCHVCGLQTGLLQCDRCQVMRIFFSMLDFYKLYSSTFSEVEKKMQLLSGNEDSCFVCWSFFNIQLS